jgi:hypothetical protein
MLFRETIALYFKNTHVICGKNSAFGSRVLKQVIPTVITFFQESNPLDYQVWTALATVLCSKTRENHFKVAVTANK